MILSFLATRWGGIVAGVLFALVALGVNNIHQQRKGAEKVVAKMEKATNENVKKADAARRSVDGVPDERLRDKWTRD